MAKKQTSARGGATAGRKNLPRGIVAFQFQDSTYQIDVARQKVYRSWVEVERNREIAVFSAYRASAGPALSLV